MLDDANFLPVLQRSDWAEGPRCVVRPVFVRGGGGGARSPLLVSYGVVGPGSTRFLSRASARAQELPLPQIDRAARDHLRLFPDRGEWELKRVEGERLYVRRGGSATSSLLISTTTMNKVHEGLEQSAAFVGVPDRATLVAAADPLVLGPMLEEMWHAAAGEGRDPLSRHVFMLRGGRVIGFMAREDDESAGEPHPTRPTAKAEAATAEIKSRAMATLVCLAFVRVAAMDGNLRDEQVEALLEHAGRVSADASRSPSTRRVLGHVQEHLQQLLLPLFERGIPSAGEIESRLRAGLAEARRAWGDADAADLGRATWEAAVRVAEASGGGGWLGLGSSIGKRERAALESLRPVLMEP